MQDIEILRGKLFGSWQSWIKIRDEAKAAGDEQLERIAETFIGKIEQTLLNDFKDEILLEKIMDFIEK